MLSVAYFVSISLLDTIFETQYNYLHIYDHSFSNYPNLMLNNKVMEQNNTQEKIPETITFRTADRMVYGAL